MIRKIAFLVAASVWLIGGPALAQFAEQASWAGNGAGTGAAQTITLGNVLTLADILGVNIKWIPSNSNSGATTLNVDGLGAQPIQRVTPAGMVALGGGEIVAGHVAIAMWNGTVFDLQNSAAPDPPGHVMDYAGAACPTGWATGGGQVISQTTQAPLYGVLGVIWGSNAGGNFTLPDLRGRTTFGQDSGGSGRITAAGGNFDGTVVGGTGGQQNQTLTQAQLPAFKPAITITDPGHSHSYNEATAGTTVAASSGPIHASQASTTGTATTGITAALTSNLGSGALTAVLSNAAIVNKCVRF
jgi:microcystin-dependent protein